MVRGLHCRKFTLVAWKDWPRTWHVVLYSTLTRVESVEDYKEGSATELETWPITKPCTITEDDVTESDTQTYFTAG